MSTSPGNPSADEPSGAVTRARRFGPLVTVSCVVVALVLIDLAFGAVLTSMGLWPADRGDVWVLEHERPEEAAPATRDEPWADELMETLLEFQSDRYDYEPFVQQQTYAFESRYLNTTDEERVSYAPSVPPGRDPVRVAFFGGSVVFGIGQRDEHTPPSEFARIAEENGVPVEVHNFGFPRLVAWQELHLFERQLAAGEEFDLVVFLDGFNEFYMQGQGLSWDPTHHAATAMNEIVADFREVRATEPGALDGIGEMVTSYRRASGVWRAIDRLRGVEAPLPGSRGFELGTPEEQTEAALGIYRRAVGRIESLAERHDTPVRMFWQPREPGWPPEVIDALPESVIDVSQVFDGHPDPLYIDPVHTNEAGSRMLAAAIWEAVGGDVVAAANETPTSAP